MILSLLSLRINETILSNVQHAVFGCTPTISLKKEFGIFVGIRMHVHVCRHLIEVCMIRVSNRDVK
jgi:hypothetical protein